MRLSLLDSSKQCGHSGLVNRNNAERVLLATRLRSLKQWQKCPVILQAGRTALLGASNEMRQLTLKTAASDASKFYCIIFKET